MRIAVFDLYVYLLFFSLFKAYFIPDALRQFIKIITLFLILMFLLKRLKKKDIFNFSLLFSSVVIISGLYNYILDSYTTKALLDSLLYALTFYDLYSIFLYAKKNGFITRVSNNLYRANLLYCLLTIVSVLVVGVENNSNVSAYLFGNKFTSSYLFIMLIALYGFTHNMNRKKNKIRICLLVVIGCIFTVYVGCGTATVALVTAVLVFFIGKSTKLRVIQSPIVVVSIIMGTAIIPFVINAILKIDVVRYIIFDIFHRSITVYGRFEIYNKYLYDLLCNKFWLGYGYSNGVMMSVSGVFGNAQNGLLEQMMNFGFIGGIAILVLVFYALRKKKELSYMLILLYAMIVAAIFEVTINWFFWIAVFSIQWLEKQRGEINEKSDNFIDATS
ncbi:O-antigen ligase family protein [Peptostreptococcus porci]|uniref:O-antigen ligase family protein n=1 Tax=Peptostreptococcus porci TaxID=2652282 RepID=UPI002A85CBA4|nr:O-antigen ligase family protein [Peptostreptococcus porci]MDY4669392.1 hypothetical protein [Oliverpabstia sp.]MDY5435551.1 hypothetical protein [Peptostreptococcus porci]